MASVRRILRTLKNSAVEIGKLRTVNQTFVVARQDQDVNLTADTPDTIPFNVEDEDALGEFDGGEFTPDESGWYEFLVHAEFAVGSDTDELKLSILDVNAGETVFESELRASGAGNRDRSLNAVVDLESGEPYSVQAENSDSNDTINGKPKRTKMVITQEPSGFSG